MKFRKHITQEPFKKGFQYFLKSLEKPMTSVSPKIRAEDFKIEEEGQSLEDIAENVMTQYGTGLGSSSRLFPSPGLANRAYLTDSALLGEMYEEVNAGACFNWISDPMHADMDIILGERIRNLIGIPKSFSYGERGLGKACLGLNDALLLSLQDSKVRAITDSVSDEKLVVYGVEKGTRQSPLSLLNLNNRRPPVYHDTLGLDLNFQILETEINDDIKEGLSPMFVLYRIRTAENINDQLKKLVDLNNQYGVDIFLDFSHIDLNFLATTLNSKFLDYYQYMFVDFSKIAGLTCQYFFVKDRFTLTGSLQIVNKDYYSINLKQRTSERTLLTEEKFDAHHFNIGFGNKTAIVRLFFAFEQLGVEGLQRLVKEAKEKAIDIEEGLKQKLNTEENLIQRVDNRVYWTGDSVEEIYNSLDYPYELFSIRKFEDEKGNEKQVGEFVAYSGDISHNIIDETLDLIFPCE